MDKTEKWKFKQKLKYRKIEENVFKMHKSFKYIEK